MSDCIFCKIVDGEIPSYTVYEDDDFKAIMDISPASEGHMIIIAKKHAANLFELDDEVAARVFVVAKKLATAITEELECDGVNILQNNGEAAGQTVFHFHTHVIPRYFEDDVNIKWGQEPADMAALEELAKKIAIKVAE